MKNLIVAILAAALIVSCGQAEQSDFAVGSNLVCDTDAGLTECNKYIPATVESNTMFEGVIVACGDGILTDSGNIVELKVKVCNKIVFGKTGAGDIVVRRQLRYDERKQRSRH